MEQRHSFTLSLTSALDASGWSTPRRGKFTSGEEIGHQFLREPGPTAGLDERGKSRPPPEFEPRIKWLKQTTKVTKRKCTNTFIRISTEGDPKIPTQTPPIRLGIFQCQDIGGRGGNRNLNTLKSLQPRTFSCTKLNWPRFSHMRCCVGTTNTSARSRTAVVQSQKAVMSASFTHH